MKDCARLGGMAITFPHNVANALSAVLCTSKRETLPRCHRNKLRTSRLATTEVDRIDAAWPCDLLPLITLIANAFRSAKPKVLRAGDIFYEGKMGQRSFPSPPSMDTLPRFPCIYDDIPVLMARGATPSEAPSE